MIRTIKVMLCPNNRQRTQLFECAGTARFIYNWVLDYEHKTAKVRKLKKKKRRLQRRISKK